VCVRGFIKSGSAVNTTRGQGNTVLLEEMLGPDNAVNWLRRSVADCTSSVSLCRWLRLTLITLSHSLN